MESNYIAIFIALLSFTSALGAFNGSDITINDIKNALPDGVSLPPELDGIEIPKVEEAVKVFKEKCVKVSGSDAAFEEANQASTTLMECIQKLVNFTTLPDEIEKAKPNGNLDTVFNKYCDKRNEAIKCVDSFTKSLDPCLNQEEKDQKVVFVNITKSLLEFVCHENGNQIALFIAEEGPECFSTKQDAIQDCFNATLGDSFGNQIPSIDNLPSLVIKEENCRQMDKLETCVVRELETCKESTPANLVEALFRFVRKETPCKNFTKIPPKGDTGSAAITRLSFSVLIGTWLMALFAKAIVSFQ